MGCACPYPIRPEGFYNGASWRRSDKAGTPSWAGRSEAWLGAQFCLDLPAVLQQDYPNYCPGEAVAVSTSHLDAALAATGTVHKLQIPSFSTLATWTGISPSLPRCARSALTANGYAQSELNIPRRWLRGFGIIMSAQWQRTLQASKSGLQIDRKRRSLSGSCTRRSSGLSAWRLVNSGGYRISQGTVRPMECTRCSSLVHPLHTWRRRLAAECPGH